MFGMTNTYTEEEATAQKKMAWLVPQRTTHTETQTHKNTHMGVRDFSTKPKAVRGNKS